MPSVARDDGLRLHPFYDAIPDRGDEGYLFCLVCDPETFFCPIGKPELLLAHYAQTGHDKVPVEEAHGIPEMAAHGAVKAISCKTCHYVAASKSDLMKHYWREHKRAQPSVADSTRVEAPAPATPPTVVQKVKSFLKNLP